MVLFKARDAEVIIYTTGVSSFNNTADLFAQMGTIDITLSAEAKDISMSGAEADVEQIKFFGLDAGSRQNAEIDEGDMSMREFSATLVYKDNDVATLSTAAATTITVSNTEVWARTQGDGARAARALIIKVRKNVGGTDYQSNLVMNNIYFTKMGDIESDAEGHLTQSIAGKCLAKDVYDEYRTT
jgi:hypothetical protein